MAESRHVPDNDAAKSQPKNELEESEQPDIKTGIKSGPEMDVDNGL